ncbi:glucose 1-dehydrogenase [Nocardia farcinica]|uniref:Putative short chain dehydrogenase n=1 Tax=Nocardia farcinica (strain IFM 10152) TaxID=247156 RepID=Q5YQ83_NOCFA|nr:glucose 1-dehydrogenase [Nocardia farcinica]BAD59658.1 putative short chain dehydrogenase [Nocardia farcinica IFM 10152]
MGVLDGKVALITGGARGMGAEHARQFVAEGARVVFGDVRDEEGEALAAELGDDAHYVHHDVTSESEWSEVVAATIDRFGKLDILVNNAGINRFAPICEQSLDEFRLILDTNLTSTWLGIRAAAPVMSDGGSIVNMSSVEGYAGAAGLSAYAASKFGIRGLTKVAARELGSRNIRVNSVHPGGIATPMNTEFAPNLDPDKPFVPSLPIARWGRAAEVTHVVVFLASDAASYCTGSEVLVDGGLLAGPGY